MTFSAEAYLFFPGGFGTLDEFFEILTLVQTNKIEKVPLILVGNEYWQNLDNYIRKEMFQINSAVDENDMSLYTITEDEDKILDIIKRVPIRSGMDIHHKIPDDRT